MIDPIKDNFTQAIFKDDYYKAFSISKDEDLDLHLKRRPSFCFVNNYFDIGLKAWLTNMEIKSDFNDIYVYMCQCFSKTEDQC